MDLQQIEKLFSCILDLKRKIVAVNLARSEEEFQLLEQQALKGSLSFCSMVRLASIGKGRKALKQNISCPGALEVFRFTEPGPEACSGERLHGFGLYASRELAAEVQGSMARMDSPSHGISTQPLSASSAPPAALVMIVDSYQAMRLVQGWAYHHGQLDSVIMVGNRGVCSELAARPLLTGKPNISSLCANTRYTARWADSELGIGFPYDCLESLLDGLVKTIPAVETRQSRAEIAARCKEAGVTLNIPDRDCYYRYS